MARWRVPSNAIFRAASSRGVPRLQYAPQHEWDPQRISAVAGMVSNVNQAATNVMGIRPLDALTAGISSLAADKEKKGSGVQTGADIMRRAALARAKRDRAAAELKKMRAGESSTGPVPGVPDVRLPDSSRFGPLGEEAPKPPTPTPPVGGEGVDLSGRFPTMEAARRYARSTLGIKKFKWGAPGQRPGIYSTRGYKDRFGPRPPGGKPNESMASWMADLERARKKRGPQPAPAPAPTPEGVTPLTRGPLVGVDPAPRLRLEGALRREGNTEERPLLAREPMRLKLGVDEPYRSLGLTNESQKEAMLALGRVPDIARRLGVEESELAGTLSTIVKILSDPSHPSYQSIVDRVRPLSGSGELYGAGAKMIELLRPEAAPPEAPDYQWRLGGGEEVPPTSPKAPLAPAPPVIGGPQESPVLAARKREQARIARIAQGIRVEDSPEFRRRQIDMVGSALDAGRIFMPEELPTSAEDLSAIAMIITERRALPALVAQARLHATPRTFSDLFTGAHKKRAAEQVMKSFLGGERARPTMVQLAQLDQRRKSLEQRRAGLQQKGAYQQNMLKLRLAELQDKMKTSASLRERRFYQNQYSRVQTNLALLKYRKKMGRYSRRGVFRKKGINPAELIDGFFSRNSRPSMQALGDMKDQGRKIREANAMLRILKLKSFGTWFANKTKGLDSKTRLDVLATVRATLREAAGLPATVAKKATIRTKLRENWMAKNKAFKAAKAHWEGLSKKGPDGLPWHVVQRKVLTDALAKATREKRKKDQADIQDKIRRLDGRVRKAKEALATARGQWKLAEERYFKNIGLSTKPKR